MAGDLKGFAEPALVLTPPAARGVAPVLEGGDRNRVSRFVVGLGHKLQYLLVRNRIPGNLSRQEPVMSLTYDQLAGEAMRLSAEERADLADKLWVSVDTREAVAAAWDAEIERRIAQIDSGEVETIPFEQVMAELHAKLR